MSAKTFVFQDEDHTLGNALTFCLQQNPDVVVAGYDVPHPAEESIQLRVQTIEGVSSVKAVLQAAQLLGQIADDYLTQLKDQM
ncbi:DNA-directed RNA polymerases I and III 16 kDa polypeptide [Spironucleus salmonicida]|uniref:DNA-directed RNA polymerases I and III 16 kDa polypeptide n=1 Tax=Spironucleus salmonicida TaxID=348837 RepID=V6LLB1_9EUKA|nr:DNA-directed RNA polymerases I and III 16 kDa polypeptide [Spironucleus salmonicida]|eukprot:EST41464.1 DNA-directed RNA polymerases I and III 16 kDa polypeptide [Spironucleus salmonicida]